MLNKTLIIGVVIGVLLATFVTVVPATIKKYSPV